MALVSITGGRTDFIGSVHMDGEWTGAEDPVEVSFQWGYGSFGTNTPFELSSLENGSYTRIVTVNKDRTIKYRSKARDSSGTAFGFSSGEFRTFADAATFDSGLTPGTPTTTTCPVSCTFNPKTVESVASVYIEYRVAGTGTWTTVPTPIITDILGYIPLGLADTLSGLNPGTVYEARFMSTRNTNNNVVSYSAIGTFTTVASAETIISPQLMLATAEMLTPSQAGADLSLNLNVGIMEVQAEFLTPAVYVSQQSIIDLYVQFNDVIVREVIFG